jgi:adenosylhomocysteine nucleosidase
MLLNGGIYMVIGIIGAMKEEVASIISSMDVERAEVKARMEFYSGEFHGRKIVVVECGIGKVNAAICTQILIDDFNVDKIINTGVAGGVNRRVKPGDVVISTDLIQHDVDATLSSHRYIAGQIPRMEVHSFRADEGLVELAYSAAEKVSSFNVYKGRIVSGDQVVASIEKVELLGEIFDAMAVEMEGAAIGHTCYVNNIPFVVIRSISDMADENMNNDYDKFEKIAIDNSIAILTEMLEGLK